MDVQQIIFVLSEFKFGKLESKSLKNMRKNPEKLSLSRWAWLTITLTTTLTLTMIHKYCLEIMFNYIGRHDDIWVGDVFDGQKCGKDLSNVIYQEWVLCRIDFRKGYLGPRKKLWYLRKLPKEERGQNICAPVCWNCHQVLFPTNISSSRPKSWHSWKDISSYLPVIWLYRLTAQVLTKDSVTVSVDAVVYYRYKKIQNDLLCFFFF